MTTRQEIQIAKDMIKFVNIMNDFMDIGSYMLQEIDPNKGGHLKKIDGQTQLQRTFTFDEIKEESTKVCNNVSAYHSTITNFLDKVDISIVSNGLSTWGMDIDTLLNEVSEMNTIKDSVATSLSTAKSKKDLKTIGKYIDVNVPKLTLVRRAWNIGV